MRRRWLGALALTLLVVALALPVLTYPLGGDQGEFAIIGREILAGAVPYLDQWNPKPPAIFYVYGAAMAALGYTAAALRSIGFVGGRRVTNGPSARPSAPWPRSGSGSGRR